MSTITTGHDEVATRAIRPDPALPPTSGRPSLEHFLVATEIIGMRAEHVAILTAPTDELIVAFPVLMDDGTYRVFQGFRIQHNNVLGPYKGGIRFHPTVDLEEVRNPATWMTWKTALCRLPFGGAKGGVAVDPSELCIGELERVVRRFTHALGANFGHGQRRRPHHPPSVRRKHKALAGATCAIQGFGNVGRHTARGLDALGARIVAVSDEAGGVHSVAGLDLDALSLHASVHRTVADFDGGHQISNAELLALDVDLLVPAALEHQITLDNVGSIRAHVVAEAANGPITPDADRILHDGGIEIIPDILANAGGVIVSHAEWVQNKTSEPWPLRRVEQRLAETLDDAAGRVAHTAAEHNCSRRLAAHIEAARTLASAFSFRGIFP